jgi:hypothetical protein
MMYEIQSKSDFQVGATLIVRIPEADVDKKALYTILSEQPDFVLPFRHRAIDGQIEFVYQIGNRSKLAYLSGNRSPSEYADLWCGLLQPLLDCGDWFMTPFSFVFKPEYLYCDKNGKSVSYVYIPSVQAYSDYGALKNMVTEVAKQNHVTDVNLENKVVWAIQEFNPTEFLQMVSLYKEDSPSESVSQPPHIPTPEIRQQIVSPAVQPIQQPAVEQKKVEIVPPVSVRKQSDDIAINFPADGKVKKAEKSKSGLFGRKKDKEEKPAKIQKETVGSGGFWGKKKAKGQEIIQGAAVTPKHEPIREQPIAQVYNSPIREEDDGVTQLDVHETGAPKFRYVGSNDHPRILEVVVAEGGAFTIGRFDASVGTKQSNFEFDKRTKAVSRRHAAIERSAEGYVLVDLNSAAGTFINGQKLPPNAPFKLESGFRVSFGNSGADYIWEE